MMQIDGKPFNVWSLVDHTNTKVNPDHFQWSKGGI